MFLKNKISCLLVLIMLCSIVISAQNSIEPDSRLNLVFSEKQLNDLSNDPLKVKWNNWLLDYSFEILTVKDADLSDYPVLLYRDFSNEKCKKGTAGDNVKEIDLENINIHKYYFIRNYDKPSIYRIGNTNKVISFLSQLQLTEKFNSLQNEIY